MPLKFCIFDIIGTKNLGPCPSGITIKSSGGSNRWNSRLGDYNLVNYDSSGNAIYEHAFDKGSFLYKVDKFVYNDFDNIWMVSTISIFSGFFKKALLNIIHQKMVSVNT